VLTELLSSDSRARRDQRLDSCAKVPVGGVAWEGGGVPGGDDWEVVSVEGSGGSEDLEGGESEEELEVFEVLESRREVCEDWRGGEDREGGVGVLDLPDLSPIHQALTPESRAARFRTASSTIFTVSGGSWPSAPTQSASKRTMEEASRSNH
jgi:hypothetical protein